jgi:hypothetical protein
MTAQTNGVMKGPTTLKAGETQRADQEQNRGFFHQTAVMGNGRRHARVPLSVFGAGLTQKRFAFSLRREGAAKVVGQGTLSRSLTPAARTAA